MDRGEFWRLIERARVIGGTDPEAVAAAAAQLLTAYPAETIRAAQRTLRALLVEAYTTPVLAASMIINGGASDDGFEYFRAWLITQGQEAFDRALADPDSLADLAAVKEAAPDGELECEAALGIATEALWSATGDHIPLDAFVVNYPTIDHDTDVVRLPRLARLYEED